MHTYLKNAANGLSKGFLSNEYSPPKKNLIWWHNYILFEGFWEPLLTRNLKKCKKTKCHIFTSYKQTKLDPKGGQTKGFDATFQMHIIAKIFDIIKYLKNEKIKD